MKLSSCLTFSGVGILTIALTRSSDGFRPSAEITCPMYVTCCRKNSHLSRRSFIPYSFSAERTCLIFCRCSSFIHPVTITSSRYADTYGMPETRLSTSGKWSVLVPVQMTIDCTETVVYACWRRAISLWHHRALLVNMHRAYQVLRRVFLFAAWRTVRLPSEWGAGLTVAGDLQSLYNLRICALSRSASARRQWVSPIHCGQHEWLHPNPLAFCRRHPCDWMVLVSVWRTWGRHHLSIEAVLSL